MFQSIVQLLSGLGLLLLAFKILSDNIEKLANTGLRKLFNKTANNRFIGVLIGLVVTAIIQSSGATTIMIVGFVNAGIMSLFQATAMIMGANIGTTVTAQIASLAAFDIAPFIMILAFIGVFVNMISKKETTKTLSMAFAGLGFVFLALDLMSGSMKNNELSSWMQTTLTMIENPLLLFLIGIVFTALIQSSSALTTIIISMVVAGISIGNGGTSVLFLILGTNVGSCITAIMSSFGTSTNAKRAALIHIMFNILGSIIFFIIILVFPSLYDITLKKWFPNTATQIAMFHTIFNTVSTCLFLPFISVFVKVSKFIIRDKKEEKSTTYLDERFLKTPSIAIDQAYKETIKLGESAMVVLNTSINAFLNKKLDDVELIDSEIIKIEKINAEIISYLLQLSSNDIDLTSTDERNISAIHKILIDYSREAEIADNMIKYTKTAIEKDLVFSEAANEGIVSIQERLNKSYEYTASLFNKNSKKILKKADGVEDEIDEIRSQLIDGHIKRLEEGKCSPSSNIVFISLISNLERAGDHLNYVAHTIMDSNR